MQFNPELAKSLKENLDLAETQTRLPGVWGCH